VTVHPGSALRLSSLRRPKTGPVALFLLLLASTALFSLSTPAPAPRFQPAVASTDTLATEVGYRILSAGGNAVDAAVAVGLALAVVHPQAGNIGGGGFMLIMTSDDSIFALDYREKAPRASSRETFVDERGEVIEGLSTTGYLASGVPGTLRGFEAAHKRFGRLPWKELFQPAIELAREGFRVSPSLHRALARHQKRLRLFPETARKFFPSGRVPQPGEKMLQPELARTLEAISERGADEFYEGSIAELISEQMKRHGGLITREDLASYGVCWRRPVRGFYRGYEINGMGPPSSGGVCLIELLNILERYDLESLRRGSPEYVTLLAEAEKRVFADRSFFLGDPDFVRMPVRELTSKEYAEFLSRRISLERATPSDSISHGDPFGYESTETTHYCIIDGDGNVVSNTYTLNSSFGSKVVIAGGGFLMNNEMDDFSLAPGHPNLYGLTGSEANAVLPGKRMLSSMSPTILTRGGRPFLVVGSPGGSKIITSVLQVILNVIDFRMSLPEAISTARFHHQWLPDLLQFEKGSLDEATAGALSERGYTLREVEPFGDVQAILVDPATGGSFPFSDPRR